MDAEMSKGVGRAMRRRMVRQWKASARGKSLKAWALEAKVGDVALAWIEGKRRGAT